MDTLKIDAISVEEEPRWMREALALPFVQRVRGMVATLGFFMRSPRRFGQTWVAGSRELPNPLVAMAAAVSIQSIFTAEARRMLPLDAQPGLLLTVIEALGPYLLYLAIGGGAHVILRMLGSKRRLGTSVGVTLFAGAFPGTVLGMIMLAPLIPMHAAYGSLERANEVAPVWVKAALIGSVVAAYVYFVTAFVLALAGAHAVARWKAVVAGVVGIILAGSLSGGLDKVPAAAKYGHMLGPHLSLSMPAHGYVPSVMFTI